MKLIPSILSVPSAPSAKRFRHRSPARRGVALVVILCMIVLITFLVMALLVRSLDTRRVEASSVGGGRAALIAHDAARIVTDDLLKEIEAGSDSPAGTDIFVPVDATTAMPVRSLIDPAMESDSRFDRLVKQSGAPMFPSASPYAATPEPALDFSSATSTSVAADNGRILTPDRWNSPRLLTGGGFSSDAELPHWIYVDKSVGPVSVTEPSKDLTARFAFNVYAIGGLLNINVLGAPDGILPGDVLGSVGGVAPGEFSDDPALMQDALNWRNAATGLTSSDYADYVHDEGPQKGFLTTPAGDRRFLTRRDLILAATSYFANPPSGLEADLPFLTHFSRSLAAPGLSPAATAANPHPAGIQHVNTGTLTTYSNDGTAFTYNVSTGDPLLTHRFSLDKLQWLTPNGPASGSSPAAILAVFGLQWNAADSRWDFVGSDGGTAPLGIIPTLAQVATLSREPNFFEILKAAVLAGSVGNKPWGTTASPGAAAFDDVNDLQILRIGANIIDCGDTDNFPTRIGATILTEDVTVSGIEDLPYLWGNFAIILSVYDSGASGDRYRHHAVFTPQLFNPHGTSPSVATAGPQNIRLRMQGTMERISIRGGSMSSGPEFINSNVTVTLASKPFISLPITASSFRAHPDVPTTSASDPARLSAQLPLDFDGDAMGFVLFSQTHNPPVTVTGGAPVAGLRFGDGSNSMNIVLEYEESPGVWRTYDALTGLPEVPSTGVGQAGGFSFTSIKSNSSPAASVTSPASPKFTNQSLGRSYLGKPDPRSTRFALSYDDFAEFPDVDIMPPATAGFARKAPFSNWSASTTYLDLPEGGLTAATNPGQVADPDGVVRPADAYLGNAANPLKSGAMPTARPIILQRPYRSVGELGYVFRDTPWKTLDFFTERSGDSLLFDYFCTGESLVVDDSGAVVIPPVVAGKVNLNSAPSEVFQAILANAVRDAGDVTTTFSATELDAAGDDLAAAVPISSLAGIPAWTDIAANHWDASTLSLEHRTTKRARGQISRALSAVGQTRTWNLMIDVIAQSGKFPSDAADLESFVVDGEARFWVFVAIDRVTGKILETRFEPPFE